MKVMELNKAENLQRRKLVIRRKKLKELRRKREGLKI